MSQIVRNPKNISKLKKKNSAMLRFPNGKNLSLQQKNSIWMFPKIGVTPNHPF